MHILYMLLIILFTFFFLGGGSVLYLQVCLYFILCLLHNWRSVQVLSKQVLQKNVRCVVLEREVLQMKL